MDEKDHLQRHLELCKRVYERMKREGSLWLLDPPDSPISDHVIESDEGEF